MHSTIGLNYGSVKGANAPTQEKFKRRINPFDILYHYFQLKKTLGQSWYLQAPIYFFKGKNQNTIIFQ